MAELTTENTIMVAVVDDDEVSRYGLVGAVEKDTSLTLCYAVESIADLRREVALQGKPDVVLLDLSLSTKPDGIEAVTLLNRSGFTIVVVSNHFRDATIRDGYAAGAKAVLSKSSTFAEIAQAIHKAAAGHTYKSPKIAAVLLNEPGLDPQQRRVLELVAKGMTDQEIAEELRTKPRAISRQLERLREKTGTRNRSALGELFHRHFRAPRDD